LSLGTILVTDPIGGDASPIAQVLLANDYSMLVPGANEVWHDLAVAADGLIVNLAVIDAAAFARLTRCRVIARLGVGIDNIDLATARSRGIVVTNVPDYCREEVSDHALALILSMIRKIPIANADVQRGCWNQLAYRPIRRINGIALGLIGFGRVAQALARKAVALGMRVIASDPYAHSSAACPVQLVDLDSLLTEADVISIHAPLTPQTRGLIGYDVLRKTKRGAVLVNTSRGELVDESALIAALDDGRLAGAALDVIAGEPLAGDSPLRGRTNVLVTPHMAFYSEESLEELQRTAAEDVVRTLSGKSPRHRVA
jgi:D-3-phosphoglycerate dehydrogenase